MLSPTRQRERPAAHLPSRESLAERQTAAMSETDTAGHFRLAAQNCEGRAVVKRADANGTRKRPKSAVRGMPAHLRTHNTEWAQATNNPEQALHVIILPPQAYR